MLWRWVMTAASRQCPSVLSFYILLRSFLKSVVVYEFAQNEFHPRHNLLWEEAAHKYLISLFPWSNVPTQVVCQKLDIYNDYSDVLWVSHFSFLTRNLWHWRTRYSNLYYFIAHETVSPIFSVMSCPITTHFAFEYCCSHVVLTIFSGLPRWSVGQWSETREQNWDRRRVYVIQNPNPCRLPDSLQVQNVLIHW